MPRTYVITGSASGIGLATSERVRAAGDRVIGIDLRGSDIDADLSTPTGRADAATRAMEMADGVVDAVIACAGIAAPIAKTISINYFGVTEFVTALLPALAQSDAPRAAVVSSMASLQANSPELVAAALSGDEDEAVRIAEEIAARGPEAGYAIYPS